MKYFLLAIVLILGVVGGSVYYLTQNIDKFADQALEKHMKKSPFYNICKTKLESLSKDNLTTEDEINACIFQQIVDFKTVKSILEDIQLIKDWQKKDSMINVFIYCYETNNSGEVEVEDEVDFTSCLECINNAKILKYEKAKLNDV